MPRRAPHTVGLVVLPGSHLFDIAAVGEVFGTPRPDLFAPPYELRMCQIAAGEVRTQHGLLAADAHGPDVLARCDTVIVPALESFDSAIPQQLIDSLRVAEQRKARVVSLCTGAFALGAAGLLDGRHATTHWMYAEALAARHPSARVDRDVLYTCDAPIFTSAGTAAGLDLCIELVRRDHGAAVANDLARRLVVAPHRDGGQAQFVRHAVAADHDTLAPLLDWARRHLALDLQLADMARAANVSTRTLSRRFVALLGATPMQWLTTERIRHAQELLEQTDHSIERVAAASGFGTPANLRHHFTRAVATTPQAYRRRFATAR